MIGPIAPWGSRHLPHTSTQPKQLKARLEEQLPQKPIPSEPTPIAAWTNIMTMPRAHYGKLPSREGLTLEGSRGKCSTLVGWCREPTSWEGTMNRRQSLHFGARTASPNTVTPSRAFRRYDNVAGLGGSASKAADQAQGLEQRSDRGF